MGFAFSLLDLLQNPGVLGVWVGKGNVGSMQDLAREIEDQLMRDTYQSSSKQYICYKTLFDIRYKLTYHQVGFLVYKIEDMNSFTLHTSDEQAFALSAFSVRC